MAMSDTNKLRAEFKSHPATSSMGRIANGLVLLIAILAGVYQLYVRPLLAKLGHGRVIQPVGNTQCTVIPELQACEKIVIHQPSGLLYLACSTPSTRIHWQPSLTRLNASAVKGDDYVATYNPTTGSITTLKLQNFDDPRGLSLHGMDVVPSSVSPAEVFVYLVNHRIPKTGVPAQQSGADSCIEIFKATVGGDTLTHIRTVASSVIVTPNDVVGFPDGESFYFTNDHADKVGFLRKLDILGRSTTSVGFCQGNEGCKLAISALRGSNGIARALNDTIYVANTFDGKVSAMERQSDNTLVVTDIIQADRALDNLSMDGEGSLWAAGIPDVLAWAKKHYRVPPQPVGSTALRVTLNTGPSSFYGEKYSVEKVFEDDGAIAPGSTSVAYDSQRRLLFLHGLISPHLAVCKLD